LRGKPLLGLAFADLDVAAAAYWLAARPDGSPFGYVVTPNADHLVRLHRDPDLAETYRSALLRLLDSRVVIRFGRLFGLAVPRVAPGSDVTEALLRHYVRPGERVTIIGLGAVHVATLAARLGLAEPAHHNPPMRFDQDTAAFAAAVEFVLAHPSRFVFFAIGSPRQERLAAAVASTGRATGTGLCIGAALAFLAGAERRAPVFVREAGLEWLFRLLTNPRRLFTRYVFSSPRVIGLLLRERLKPAREREADVEVEAHG
jgi:exopolysaccharide biosynthesis WecB/TagA/CpsF family protein